MSEGFWLNFDQINISHRRPFSVWIVNLVTWQNAPEGRYDEKSWEIAYNCLMMTSSGDDNWLRGSLGLLTDKTKKKINKINRRQSKKPPSLRLRGLTNGLLTDRLDLSNNRWTKNQPILLTNWPMTDDKLYTSLSANTITVKLTSHFQQTKLITSSTDKHYSLDSEDDILLRLSKRQSLTQVLFKTTLARKITQYELLILLGSNHLLYYALSYWQIIWASQKIYNKKWKKHW